MKIRLYSDIHLDHYNLKDVWYPPVLPDEKDTTLILAGDLWTGTKFIHTIDHSTRILLTDDNGKPINDLSSEFSWIKTVSDRFKTVLIVLGNHDYWPSGHLTIRGGAQKCNDMLIERGFNNVKVLDCDRFIEDDIIVVGATLWTDMNNLDQWAMHNLNNVMTYDGKLSHWTGPNGQWSRFTSTEWVKTHLMHKRYISTIAEENPDKKIFVVTHHAPLTFVCSPYFKGDSANAYFLSDLSEVMLDNPNIVMWAYGMCTIEVTFSLKIAE